MNHRIGCFSLIGAAAACSILSAEPASAQVLLGVTNTSPLTFGGAFYTIDFNGGAAGGTSFGFTTTAPNQRVAFTFSAECAVDGIASRYVNIDIRVDPVGAPGVVSVAPTNDDDAFCSGNGTTTGIGALDGWVTASVTGTYVFPTPGLHVVSVGVNNANGLLARRDDMSLVVFR